MRNTNYTIIGYEMKESQKTGNAVRTGDLITVNVNLQLENIEAENIEFVEGHISCLNGFYWFEAINITKN